MGMYLSVLIVNSKRVFFSSCLEQSGKPKVKQTQPGDKYENTQTNDSDENLRAECI